MDISNQQGTVHFSRKISLEARGMGPAYENSEASIFIQFPINPEDGAKDIRANAMAAFALAKATVLDQLGILWDWNAEKTEVTEVTQTPTPAPAPAPRPAAVPQAAPAPVSRAPAQQGDEVALPAAALAQASLEPEAGGFDPYWFSEVLSFGRLKGQSWGAIAQEAGKYQSDSSKWCFGMSKSDPGVKYDGTPTPEKYLLSNAVTVARARACLEYGKRKGSAPATTAVHDDVLAVQAETDHGIVYDTDTPF